MVRLILMSSFSLCEKLAYRLRFFASLQNRVLSSSKLEIFFTA